MVTIGVFDGVHRGHAVLIHHATALAAESGLPSVVLTFDPHPTAVFAPDKHPAILTTIGHKADLLADLGVDALAVLEFTPEFAQESPAEFVDSVLAGALHARSVVVGRNFTFGHRASGTVDTLTELGAAAGFTVVSEQLVTEGTATVSATRIRGLIADGAVEEAQELMGHPFRADGIIVRGEQRGRALGYPTANVAMEDHAAVPADGVYAGRVVRLDDAGRLTQDALLGAAAISVGTNPTFDGTARTVEAFILAFDADLYGQRLGVEFCHRLRGMEKFDSIEALIHQMDADVARTRQLIELPAR